MRNAFLDGRFANEHRFMRVGEDDTPLLLGTVACENFQGDVNYIPIKAWARRAEILRDYTEKGSEITIAGNVCRDSWKNDKGEYEERMYVNVNQFNIHGRPSQADNTTPTEDPDEILDDMEPSEQQELEDDAFSL